MQGPPGYQDPDVPMSARQAMMTTLQIWGEPEAEVCLRHREPRITRDISCLPTSHRTG